MQSLQSGRPSDKNASMCVKRETEMNMMNDYTHYQVYKIENELRANRERLYQDLSRQAKV